MSDFGNYIFDLDGTLIDTKRAVQEAYRAAGVEMPESAWGLSAKEWLDDQTGEIHKRKNQFYPGMLAQFAKPMPLLGFAIKNQSTIITGASPEAVALIREIFNIENPVFPNLDARAKVSFLLDRPVGLYVDDDIRTRRLIRTLTCRWTILSPKEAEEILCCGS